MNKKRILMFLISIILVIIGTKVFTNKDMKVNFIKKQVVKDDIEIVEGDNYVKIAPKIDNIKEIAWLNESTIEFNGSKDEESKFYNYKYKIDEAVLTKDSVKAVANNMERDDSYLKIINSESYLSYDKSNSNRGLFYIENDQTTKIIDSIESDEDIKIKLSNKMDKLAYYDAISNMIKVYNLKNGNTTELSFELNDNILRNFENSVHFSYDDGYLIIESANLDNINESFFSVYGTDSGRLYGEEIYGYGPEWANNSLSISFIYSQRDMKISKDSLDNLQVVGSRIGVLNLKSRKIKYTQVIDDGLKIIDKPLWSENDKSLFILLGKYEEKYKAYISSNIFTYSIDNNTLTDLNYSIDKGKVYDSRIVLDEKKDKLFVIYNYNDSKYYIDAVDLKDRVEFTFGEVQYFEFIDKENTERLLYKNTNDENLLYNTNNSIYLTNMKSNYLQYKSNGLISQLCLSPDKTKLLAISKVEDYIELVIINLKT